ncbi:MAG TPA: DUF1236 domain-containing protein [Rhizomicrobium sp.]|jgi:hypothetical protein
MRHLWIAGVAATGILAGIHIAAAQDEAPPPGPGVTQETTTTTWTVRPEERTVIHDYVVKEKIRSVPVQSDVTVGAVLPPDVELQPVPEAIYTSVPESRRYEYFDWNGRVVFVDPDSRKVVQIVE